MTQKLTTTTPNNYGTVPEAPRLEKKKLDYFPIFSLPDNWFLESVKSGEKMEETTVADVSDEDTAGAQEDISVLFSTPEIQTIKEPKTDQVPRSRSIFKDIDESISKLFKA